MPTGSPKGASAALRRIADFPLVTMIIGIGMVIGATAAAELVYRALLQSAGLNLPEDARTSLQAALTIGFSFALYKLALRHLGERKHDDLPLKGALRGLGLGLGGGLVLFSLIVGVAALLDVYNIVGEGGTSRLLFILVTYAIVPGFMEELLFRGILFRWLEEFAGSWAALAITSALFGLGHIGNPNASAFSSFAIAVEAGVLLGGAYMLTRSLWVPIGLHAAWNFTQGFIWDVPVSGIDTQGLVEAQLSGPVLLSGGAFGLEASLIALVVATSAGVWLVWQALKQGELMRPWWVRRRLARAEREQELAADRPA